MSHNFTLEEREARLLRIEPLWKAGLSLMDIGIKLRISSEAAATAVRRARKRGDTRFPTRPRCLSQMRAQAILESVEVIDDTPDEDFPFDRGVRPSPASAWPSYARFDHMNITTRGR